MASCTNLQRMKTTYEKDAAKITADIRDKEGATSLARKISEISERTITRSAISQWTKIPVDRVPEVEQVTGIPRHELRPDRADLFPAPKEVA